MKKVLNSTEMKACDAFTIQKMQVPSAVLMERAALAVVDVLKEMCEPSSRVLVLCGSGNNGGDGFAVARLLLLEGIAADVYFAGKESSMTQETLLQYQIFQNYGGIICRNFSPSEYTVVVDALFGIGLSRPVTGELADLINDVNKSAKKVVAVDIPSGISADNGQIMGTAIKADVTVTFAFTKRGLLLCPGAQYCGKVIVKNIGITSDAYPGDYSFSFTYEKADLQLLPVRNMRTNKGSYGKVVLAGGAVDMAGAVLLAGKAAYRTGSGLVKLLASEENRTILQTNLPEALYTSWQKENAMEEALSWATVVGIGPGLGNSQKAQEVLKNIFQYWRGPLVIDADALNILSKAPEYLKNSEAKVIITPHPGEMARLTGKAIPEILDNLVETAAEFANKYHVICVLKDARTVVTDGKQLYINTSGNQGMATGGSGDVLTGIICGLLAQKMTAFEAACMGVYLHGLAGDRAGNQKGQRSMIAGDIIDGLTEIMKEQEELL